MSSCMTLFCSVVEPTKLSQICDVLSLIKITNNSGVPLPADYALTAKTLRTTADAQPYWKVPGRAVPARHAHGGTELREGRLDRPGVPNNKKGVRLASLAT